MSAHALTSNWEKQAWIEKTVRVLRAGKGLNPRDPSEKMEALLPLDKARIVDLLMADPLLGDGVLDFNLYFLGYKRDRLRNDKGEYEGGIFDFSQAIASAQALLTGGDYLKLLDYRQPVLTGVLFRPALPEGETETEPAKIRKKGFAAIQADLDQLIQWARQNPALEPKEFCPKFLESFNRVPGFFNLGIPFNLAIKAVLSAEWYGKVQLACQTTVFTEKLDLVAELSKIRRKNEIFFERLASFESAAYPMRDVRDIRELDLTGLVDTIEWTQFGFLQARTLVNSSTNYNRKRASYVLARFFCDDLTPIGVEVPAGHAQDRHGSDPACLACHYKLDPMAGFFRDRGIFLSDFSKGKRIIFDDMASADRETYQSAWKAAPGEGREWNIGFIRSISQPQLNEYGTGLEDLFAIIRKAPEVRQCLVRRMFEYYVGEDRMADPGYLESLAGDFSALTASSSSSAAFKATLKRLLLSRSFAESDPVPGQCYDFAPGATPESSPPCEVAHLLQKNCVKCHGSEGSGGLDLAHWVLQADGVRGFAHKGPDGRQRPRSETWATLLDRLSTSDPDKRMPMSTFMDALERERLYRWAEKKGSEP